MRGTIAWPTRRCRSGSRSSGWCGRRAWIYGAIAATLVAFIAGGGVGWIAHGAAAAPSAFQSFTVDALDAHRLYVVEVRHPVEVPGSERAHLQQWLTKRCGWEVRAPELDAAGLKLVGGRLLPGPTGPASFLMYESASANASRSIPRRREAETTQMRYAAQGSDAALFWADRGVGYVVSGGSDRGRLTQIAQARLRPDGKERRAESRQRPPSQFRHRKSGIKSPARLIIAPGAHAKMSSARSADRRKRPRLGFGTALVPLSRPPLFSATGACRGTVLPGSAVYLTPFS